MKMGRFKTGIDDSPNFTTRSCPQCLSIPGNCPSVDRIRHRAGITSQFINLTACTGMNARVTLALAVIRDVQRLASTSIITQWGNARPPPPAPRSDGVGRGSRHRRVTETR